LHPPTHRPNTAKSGREIQAPFSRYASKRRTEAHDAAALGRTDERAGAIRADRKSAKPCRGRRCRAGTRAARRLLKIPRIARVAAEPGGTTSELARDGFAQKDCAGLAEHRHDGRVFSRHTILERGVPPSRSNAGGIEQILDRVRDSMQRPAI